jgi:hypothetical protein
MTGPPRENWQEFAVSQVIKARQKSGQSTFIKNTPVSQDIKFVDVVGVTSCLARSGKEIQSGEIRG